MKILVNFSTLKKGGGQNVALNFLSALEQEKTNLKNFHFLVVKDSLIEKLLVKKGWYNYSTLPSNPLKRIIYEVCTIRRVLKKKGIDIIYTYFGYGLFLTNLPQVVGAAASNLFYPEVNFWEGYKGLALLKKKIIDRYRIWGIKRSDGIIFENKDLEDRFTKIYNLELKIPTITIKPSINLNYEKKEYKLPEQIKDYKKGLFLCGWQLNKNILQLPLIAFFLKQEGILFHFIITAPSDNSFVHKQFLSLVKQHDVSDYISVVGAVQKEELYSLYKQVDIVFLLSKLESFSNNIIEAWNYKRLLIISDMSWARSICKNGAIYVDRDVPQQIALTIKECIETIELYNSIVEEGDHMLKGYPSIEEKTKSEIRFIKSIYERN